MTFNRLISIEVPENRSAFLWGPRKVGKSYWIREHMKEAILIDLLKTEVFAEYISRPALLRERYADATQRIVIDEVQKVPAILDEVHWLIENKGLAFLLTGSSARKLRRGHANLLGGRAWRFTMAPLCYGEVRYQELEKVMVSGLLPSHYTSADPIQELRAYIADYLKEEIAAEAVVRNIPAFADFLRIAAITSGELLNYTNVAREVGVSAKVVREYFQILEDTLLGFRLPPLRKACSRRLIETEKFYLFDVGVTNYLARRKPKEGTPEFGNALENLVMMELQAYKAYKDPELPLSFWRTASGLEVDFILGDLDVAIEVKSSKRVHETDAKALHALSEDYNVKQKYIVSLESEQKKLQSGVECVPLQWFLRNLWEGNIV